MQPAPDPLHETRRLNTLFADDDAVSGALATALLRQLGLPPPTLVRDADALHAALGEEDSAFDLLLLEPALPGLDDRRRSALGMRLEADDTAPALIELSATDQATPVGRLHLCKPLKREGLQAVLAGLDFDPVSWDDLLRLLGHAGAGEMVATLKQDLREQTLTLDSADGAHLARIAHRLRGAAQQLGARRLAAGCAQVEATAASRPHAASLRLQALLGRFSILNDELERRLAS